MELDAKFFATVRRFISHIKNGCTEFDFIPYMYVIRVGGICCIVGFINSFQTCCVVFTGKGPDGKVISADC